MDRCQPLRGFPHKGKSIHIVGIWVAGPGYVAFVPTERPKHLAAELAWGVAGFVEVNARKVPPQQIVDQIRAAPTDANVERLSSGFGGRLWRVDAASVREKKIPLRRSKRGLWFQNGNETIRFARAIPLDEIMTLRSLLASWTWQ